MLRSTWRYSAGRVQQQRRKLVRQRKQRAGPLRLQRGSGNGRRWRPCARCEYGDVVRLIDSLLACLLCWYTCLLLQKRGCCFRNVARALQAQGPHESAGQQGCHLTAILHFFTTLLGGVCAMLMLNDVCIMLPTVRLHNHTSTAAAGCTLPSSLPAHSLAGMPSHSRAQ